MHVAGHNFNSSGRGRTGLISGVRARQFIQQEKRKEKEKKNHFALGGRPSVNKAMTHQLQPHSIQHNWAAVFLQK